MLENLQVRMRSHHPPHIYPCFVFVRGVRSRDVLDEVFNEILWLAEILRVLYKIFFGFVLNKLVNGS